MRSWLVLLAATISGWQWQLSGTIDESVDAGIFDVDLFDSPPETIARLHARGRLVICYFSAGTWESWRSDAADLPSAVRGDPDPGWPGERWLDIRDEAVRRVMRARLDLAAGKGCDGVEPDNVDGYANQSGFDLTAADQLAFDRFLARAAHDRGLSIGLKNDPDQAAELEPSFDWALVEECLKTGECGRFSPFLRAGKAVLHVEYEADVCRRAPAEFLTLIKHRGLDAWRVACESAGRPAGP